MVKMHCFVVGHRDPMGPTVSTDPIFDTVTCRTRRPRNFHVCGDDVLVYLQSFTDPNGGPWLCCNEISDSTTVLPVTLTLSPRVMIQSVQTLPIVIQTVSIRRNHDAAGLLCEYTAGVACNCKTV